jgi:hypothetical protein
MPVLRVAEGLALPGGSCAHINTAPKFHTCTVEYNLVLPKRCKVVKAVQPVLHAMHAPCRLQCRAEPWHVIRWICNQALERARAGQVTVAHAR